MSDGHAPGGRVPPAWRSDSTNYRTLPWPTRLRLMIEARQEEENDLAKAGTPRHYFIIRPVNPFNPPTAQDMTRMRDAITTLAALGMICGPEGDTGKH